MNNKLKVNLVTSALLSLLIALPVRASITKVGNGDDGSDLEGAHKIENGILVETKKKAIAQIKRLDTAAIEHLGALLPEVERSEMYLVTRESHAKLDEDHGPESSDDGSLVFARTFAEPYAATRFFPSALTLNEDQLIALHVHEALHRALPASVRENEKVVTKITLAITAPDATNDRVRRVVAQEVPQDARATAAFEPGVGANSSMGASIDGTMAATPQTQTNEHPSTVTYAYRSFFISDRDKSAYPIQSLQSLQSTFYPFGDASRSLGLGIGASYVKTDERASMGPLELSARLKLTTLGAFDVGLFADHSFNALAPDELRNSRIGRDVTTIGLKMKRDARHFYMENVLSYSGESSSKQTLGQIQYTHTYGAITAATVHMGGRYAGVECGGFAEAALADPYRVQGGAFQTDSGRYRIITAGPELAYSQGPLRAAVSARWVVDATNNASLDDLGDMMGQGLGQGSVTSSLSYKF